MKLKSLLNLDWLILITIFLISDVIAQDVFLRYNHPVHEFLGRLDAKGLVVFSTEVKPITRRQAAAILKELEQKTDQLNSLEFQEYLFFRSEFANELGVAEKGGKIEWNHFDNDSIGYRERPFLYKFTDEQFSLRLSPILGYGQTYVDGEMNRIRYSGANIYGYADDWLGASFEYVDYGELGNKFDPQKKFSPETGAYINNVVGNNYDHSDIKGNITFSWKWGYVSIIKDYQTWGHGEFGNVILSNKAPSFAQFRLFVNPVPWFRFYYYQGWLNSQIKDSSNIYYSHTESPIAEAFIPFRDKFIVSNLASFSVIPEIDISLGNAFVYGPNFRIETLMPIMYYKGLDHNTGRIAGDDGNGMIFLDYKLKYPVKSVSYFSVYIDVLNLRDLLRGRTDNQCFAFTLGTKRYDLFTENLDIIIEYTRANPWVYENRNQLTDYKHLNYQLGHWIGQNADQVRVQLNYSHLRGLKYKFYFERIRKGIEADISKAYEPEKYGFVNFLDGPVRKDVRFGFDVSYEWIYDLKARFFFELSDITDEDPLRTPEYLKGRVVTTGFLFSYGI